MIDKLGTIDERAMISNFLKTQEGSENSGFGQVFMNALEEVNNLQLDSLDMDRRLALGEIDNIHDVSIAAQKAYLSLNIATTVRNKVIEAYNEIMRMQV